MNNKDTSKEELEAALQKILKYAEVYFNDTRLTLIKKMAGQGLGIE